MAESEVVAAALRRDTAGRTKLHHWNQLTEDLEHRHTSGLVYRPG
jgi:hypothetical protein